VGQWVIGSSLGLYFTPEMVRLIGINLPLLLAGALFSLALGGLGAMALRRLGDTDFRTAWFASAIGGASEMTNLGERHHARTDLVASAHSLRVLMVVLVVPLAFQTLNIRGDILPAPATLVPVSATGLVKLIAVTAAGGLLFQRIRFPNPWVLGPMLILALFTSNGVAFSAMPPELSKAGQLFIGWSLGSRIGPDFFSRAPRYLSAVALINAFNILLAFGFGYLLSLLSSIPFPTLVLATSPGGIAEMSITAKALHLDAPVVAAFHVVRALFVLLLTAPIYLWIIRRIGAGGEPSRSR